jgi:hypothetical protein
MLHRYFPDNLYLAKYLKVIVCLSVCNNLELTILLPQIMLITLHFKGSVIMKLFLKHNADIWQV